MSLLLDTGNFKNAYINGLLVREIWFRNNLIYVKKEPPTVSLSVVAGSGSGKILMIGKFEDYEHINRYYDEAPLSSSTTRTHAIIFHSFNKLGTRSLTYGTKGCTKLNFSEYSDGGIFSYELDVTDSYYLSTKLAIRACVGYLDETNLRRHIAYSDTIIASYNSLI